MTGFLQFEASIGFARVAVERGMDRYPDGLTYAIPPTLSDLVAGERVVVPLGSGDRGTTGYVVEVGQSSDLDPTRVKPITGRDTSAVRIPPRLLELAEWVSRYYCTPIGMTLASMVPAAVKRNVGASTRRLVARAPTQPETTAKLTKAQRAVLKVLDDRRPEGSPVDIRELADAAGVRTTGPIMRLAQRGHVVITMRTTIEARWAESATDASVPLSLTDEQRHVIDAITAKLGDGFSAHLLRGVTGSGKTEVYIRLIHTVIARGLTTLVLVPEISLTPQTAGRLVGRFPDQRVAILHSGLTQAQRHQQWALVARGAANIILGARSAVFAPVPDDTLGLVIVDEEHDGSFKQDQAPRYNGRDVAVRLAHLSSCPIVLGSATPSLESWHNATERGGYMLHELSHRAPGMRLPSVRVVDLADERRARGDRNLRLIGPTLEGACRASLARGGQIILLLNRRGYASYIACPDPGCGWVMQCDDCDATMVFHRRDELPQRGFLRCHHCECEQRMPATCEDCGRPLIKLGLGTQRVEEELARLFPELEQGRTLVRVDSDTMHSARDFHTTLERFSNRDIHMLIGTQMIAKGLDFPGVDLVGVVNADTAINLPDYRAAERTFQLVSQVAGRSGRSPDPEALGRVVVQSFNPDVPAIQLAARHDYLGFVRMELESRRACDLPPFSRMARIVVRDEDHERATNRAAVVADGLRHVNHETVRVRGPAPCPIARIARFHRYQIEVFAPDAARLQSLLTEARNRRIIHSGSDMAVDVDPIALL